MDSATVNGLPLILLQCPISIKQNVLYNTESVTTFVKKINKIKMCLNVKTAVVVKPTKSSFSKLTVWYKYNIFF